MKSFALPPLALAILSTFPAGVALAEASALAEVTVTATREGQLLSETPATVGVIKEKTLREVKPTHPTEIMGQVAGVWVNVTGGEGHQTAIRQPLTTNPVYLYLEDGVPTRSTGFFNHNALYEVNLPMAGGIEISKGPGSALYGSDAIGGVVNFITRKDFQGIELMAGASRPRVDGGNRDEAHAIIGIQGDKGRILGGASRGRAFVNVEAAERGLSGGCGGERIDLTAGYRPGENWLGMAQLFWDGPREGEHTLRAQLTLVRFGNSGRGIQVGVRARIDGGEAEPALVLGLWGRPGN